MKCVLFALASACVLITVKGYIVSGPDNTAIVSGGMVYNPCRAAGNDTRIQWWEYVTNPNGAMISDGGSLSISHPNYARYLLVTDQPGQYDFVITQSVDNDGGYYQCVDTHAAPPDTVVRGAELVVIAAPPNCTSTTPASGNTIIEGDYFTMTCLMYFTASPGVEPLMTWNGPDPYQAIYTVTNTSVFSGISFTANRDMESKFFSCLTNFTQKGFTNPDGASNIPTYAYTWRSSQLFIAWPPKNMYADPSGSSYEVGTSITCYYDAFPLATRIYWQSLRTNQIWNTNTFTITADMVGNQTMRCHVENVINGIFYYNDLFVILPVNAPPTTPSPGPDTTTVTFPAQDNCLDLTGRWEANNPRAVMCIWLDYSLNGVLMGLFKNATDTYFADIYGRVQLNTFDQGGFSAVWPGTLGVSGHVLECTRCRGVETLIVSQISRSYATAPVCGDPGVTNTLPDFTFYRVTNSPPCTGQPPSFY